MTVHPDCKKDTHTYILKSCILHKHCVCECVKQEFYYPLSIYDKMIFVILLVIQLALLIIEEHSG